MPSPATGTATSAQTRAAGTRMLGFYESVGGVKVDALIDPANFLTRLAAGGFFAGNVNGDGYAQALYLERVSSGAPWMGFSVGLDPTTQLTHFNSGGSSNGGFVWNNTNELARLNNIGNLTLGYRTGPQASPTQFRMDTSYANTATPTNQQLKFELLHGANNTEAYGWTLDNLGRLWHFAGNSAGPTGGHIFATGNSAKLVIDTPGNIYPGADNAQALGVGSFRWSVVYAATGTINTCDIRLKFYRAEPALTPDEHAAVLECFDTFGFFQYLDAKAREEDGGSAARWHFGPRAQEVWSHFASFGLAAELVEDEHGDLVPPAGSVPPAFLCFDAWSEETAPIMAWWRPSDILGADGEPVMVPCAEGEEGTEQRPTGETYVTRAAGNIFGIRVDQLQSLMLVALNKERLAHAVEIAALRADVAALGAGA